MSASSEAFDSLGWTQQEAARHLDALPLLDDPVAGDPASASFHRMHWISAGVALALFVLARLDLLPAMPW
jgi:hypothetical protein